MPLIALQQNLPTKILAEPPVTPPLTAPVISAQSFSVPNNAAFMNVHALATTGGAPTGFTLGGTDAASFTVTPEGVVRAMFVANNAAKSTYTFTATASNAAGISTPATITCNIVASGFILAPLQTASCPANTPAGEMVGGLSFYGTGGFSLSSASITATTHPGQFTVGADAIIRVATGAVLSANTVVTLSVNATQGSFSDTEQVRITVGASETVPVIASDTIAIVSGLANRTVGIITLASGSAQARTSNLVAQSNAGLFALLSTVGIYAQQAIASGSGPYWIDVTLSNYGGTSPTKRISLIVSAGPGSSNIAMPEDTAGPIAGTPSL